MRWNKIGIIAQTGAPFPSNPRLLQMAMLNKYRENWSDDTLHLKRLFLCAPLRYSVKNIKLETWTCKRRRFFFTYCTYDESWTPIRTDCFKVILSTL